MKKLWIVTEYYYPMVTTTGFYMTEIAEKLAKEGLDVNVICTNARYYDSEIFDYEREELHKGVKIYRIKVDVIDKNSFVKRTWRMLYTSVLIGSEILRRVKQNDKVLLVTNPAFIVAVMPILCLLKKIRYDILVHDIFPENLVAIGKLRKKSFIDRILTWWFNIGYNKSSRCISIGRDMSDILMQKISYLHPIELITNWADTTDVYPINKYLTNLYNKYYNKQFVFQFAGNLGYAQGLDNLLDAISLFREENVSFCFVGTGAKAGAIEKFSKKNSNVVYAGFQERSSQNDFLNACDVSIVTLSEGMYGLGVPSKSYNIMAAGKPILFIGNPNSEIALCIQEHNIGWVVEPNNPKALRDKFEEIYLMRNLLHSWSKRIRDVAVNEYSKEVVLEKYNRLYKDHE